MANDTQSLYLSATEVLDLTGWPQAMVNDYISRGSDYMLVGIGSPENVEASNRTRQYLDADTGTLYVNPDVGVRVGWVAV